MLLLILSIPSLLIAALFTTHAYYKFENQIKNAVGYFLRHTLRLFWHLNLKPVLQMLGIGIGLPALAFWLFIHINNLINH